MKVKYGLISADSHIVLDRDSFLRHMSTAKWGDLIPQVRETEGRNGRKVERWFVHGESTGGWGANLLEYTDHQFENDKVRNEGYPQPELFRRQCYFTGWYDRASLKTRHHIAVENILWCTNFPRATSTWPQSRQVIDGWARDVPPEEQTQILWGNAAKLYGIVEPGSKTSRHHAMSSS